MNRSPKTRCQLASAAVAGGAYVRQQRVASPVLSVATGGLASVILHQGPPSDEMHLTINTARPTRGLYATRGRGFGQSPELRAMPLLLLVRF